jgi:hypothetical protein
MDQEPNHIDAAIADLEAWHERIAGAIETLRYLRAQGGALPAGVPLPSAGRTMSPPEIPHDAFFQMTVPDAAEKYLKLVKKTKPNPELSEALLKGGLKSSAKNFPEMIRTVLSREPRFVRVNSEWGLSEWYPGMRKRQRSRSPEQAQEEPESSSKERKGVPQKRSGQSLRDRALKFLDSHRPEAFGTATIAERLEAPYGSTAAALSSLSGENLILRPERGKYKSKQAV